VPTDIYFVGSNLRVAVHEEASQVAEVLSSANGLPVRFTDAGGEGEVYVNPRAVAFWGASEPASQLEPERESDPVRLPRDTVTTIWGKPVQKKPRG
jgi:hypothetical protein